MNKTKTHICSRSNPDPVTISFFSLQQEAALRRNTPLNTFDVSVTDKCDWLAVPHQDQSDKINSVAALLL